MSTIMSWSKCSVKIAKTGAADAMGTPLVSVGTIKDKTTVLATGEGEKLNAVSTGGVLEAMEGTDGEITLVTRIIEPEFPVIAKLIGSSVVVQANALIAATTIQVEKGSAVAEGMYLSNGTVQAVVTDIDTTDPAFDELTITLGAALTAGDVLYESKATGGLVVKTLVVPDQYSVEVTPKNIGATGIRARKCSVEYKEGQSEDEGMFGDLVFTFLECADEELYTQFKKTA